MHLHYLIVLLLHKVGLSTLSYGDKLPFMLKASMLATDADTSCMQPFEVDLLAAFVGSKCQ